MVLLYCLNEDNATPWVEAGFDVLMADRQHPAGGGWVSGIRKLHADLQDGFSLAPEDMARLVFVGAFPPCDNLAISGARWFKGKGLRALSLSIALFATAAEFCEASGVPYFIENPMSTISTYWRKPDFKFHPWHFTGYCIEDHYTKTTWLWTGGGFSMPLPYTDPKFAEVPPDDRIHKCPPSAERHNIRSATPKGFMRAVCMSNIPLV